MRSGLFSIVACSLGLACSAEAAGPRELDERPTEQLTRSARAESVPAPAPAQLEPMPAQLEMAELSLVDQPLAPATDPVDTRETEWRFPRHEPRPTPGWIRHQAIRAETIEELALRYGVRASKIRAWNEMGPDEQPNQVRLPELKIFARRDPVPRERLTREVVEGDTWGAIARRYGVDYRALRKWNVGAIGRSLELGETVEIWIEPVVYDSIVHDEPANPRAALVRPGAHGVGPPQAGMLVAGVQIPPGEGYELRYPNSAYGTTWAVRQTVAALDRFATTSDYPHPIKVGTMSRPRGGEIGHHVSHQTGRDLDIRLPLRAEVPQGLKPTPRRVDWRATWELVDAFASSSLVNVIFLDYSRQRRLYKAAKKMGASEEQLDAMLQFPRGSKAALGLIRHSPGHDGHIHVRFPCGPDEPLCVD